MHHCYSIANLYESSYTKSNKTRPNAIVITYQQFNLSGIQKKLKQDQTQIASVPHVSNEQYHVMCHQYF